MNARNDPLAIAGDDVDRSLDALRNLAYYPRLAQCADMLGTQDSCVMRTGSYAGSIENAAHFSLLDLTLLAPVNAAPQARKDNACPQPRDRLA